MLPHDEAYLMHYGKKGMRWGVRQVVDLYNGTADSHQKTADVQRNIADKLSAKPSRYNKRYAKALRTTAKEFRDKGTTKEHRRAANELYKMAKKAESNPGLVKGSIAKIYRNSADKEQNMAIAQRRFARLVAEGEQKRMAKIASRPYKPKPSHQSTFKKAATTVATGVATGLILTAARPVLERAIKKAGQKMAQNAAERALGIK